MSVTCTWSAPGQRFSLRLSGSFTVAVGDCNRKLSRMKRAALLHCTDPVNVLRQYGAKWPSSALTLSISNSVAVLLPLHLLIGWVVMYKMDQDFLLGFNSVLLAKSVIYHESINSLLAMDPITLPLKCGLKWHPCTLKSLLSHRNETYFTVVIWMFPTTMAPQLSQLSKQLLKYLHALGKNFISRFRCKRLINRWRFEVIWLPLYC